MRHYPPNSVCSVQGCDRRPQSNWLCDPHYRRQMKGTSLNTPIRLQKKHKNIAETCDVESCDSGVTARGKCSSHYRRWLAGRDLHTPIRPRAAQGSGCITPDGYRIFKTNGKSIMGHRIAMEEMLGRPLLPGENVHHLNGIRDDNRPENLELWITSQPSGQRVEDALTWARELIDRYSPSEEMERCVCHEGF